MDDFSCWHTHKHSFAVRCGNVWYPSSVNILARVYEYIVYVPYTMYYYKWPSLLDALEQSPFFLLLFIPVVGMLLALTQCVLPHAKTNYFIYGTETNKVSRCNGYYTLADMNYCQCRTVSVICMDACVWCFGLELSSVDNIKMRKINVGVIVDTVIAKRSIKYIRLRYIIFAM